MNTQRLDTSACTHSGVRVVILSLLEDPENKLNRKFGKTTLLYIICRTASSDVAHHSTLAGHRSFILTLLIPISYIYAVYLRYTNIQFHPQRNDSGISK